MITIQQLIRYRITVASSNKSKAGSRGRVQKGAREQGAGQVRIIAGRWRGRKLAVPNAKGLRPTGDRVRETLFNWLQADVAGAHCLDLFAGSGALGFEALSRYARSVSFVETDAEACRSLQHACEMLGVVLIEQPIMPGGPNRGDTQFRHNEMSQVESETPVVHLHSGSANSAIAQWRQAEHKPVFDLVFIDPPFESGCQWEMLAALAPSLLAEGALVYLESPSSQANDRQMPVGCELVREKRFGDVKAWLVRYSGTQGGASAV